MKLTALELARLVAILAPYRNEVISRPIIDRALLIAKESCS